MAVVKNINTVTLPSDVLHNSHSRFHPYLSNIYTIGHNLVNGEILYILYYLDDGEIRNRLYSMLYVIFFRFFNKKSGYLDKLYSEFQIRNFMEILQVEVALFHADRQTNGQTDTTRLTVAFRSCFATKPKFVYQERKASNSESRRLGGNNTNIQAHKQTINNM